MPGPYALEGPRQVDPLGPAKLGPEIPGLPDARRERPDRVVARIEALVDLVPGDRRRRAREGAGAGAVGGRQALAADVLQVVDVDGVGGAAAGRALDGGVRWVGARDQRGDDLAEQEPGLVRGAGAHRDVDV